MVQGCCCGLKEPKSKKITGSGFRILRRMESLLLFSIQTDNTGLRWSEA
jgi:hypothetical protein